VGEGIVDVGVADGPVVGVGVGVGQIVIVGQGGQVIVGISQSGQGVKGGQHLSLVPKIVLEFCRKAVLKRIKKEAKKIAVRMISFNFIKLVYHNL